MIVSQTGLGRGLRADFAQALESRLQATLGMEGSEQRTRLEGVFAPLMTDGRFDLSTLPKSAEKELLKLQKASEDFEAYFIKGLLAQMRSSSFSEEDSPMTGFAKETMDQAIADQAAQSPAGLGIARGIFLTMGDVVVRQAAGRENAAKTSE